ncbi:HU family DNA-binding protein [Bacteroides sp.]
MSKHVTYSVVPRKNLIDKDAPIKYYAQAQASGDVDVKEMAQRIEKACTVTRADVMATLIALEETIVEGLQRGEIVRLGEIGTFQIGLRGKGAEVEEDYSVSLIKKAKVNFRPGVALTGILSDLSYAKVGKLPVKKKEEGGGSGEGEGEDPAA